MEIQTIWRDEHLEAVDKPPGLPTTAERWDPAAPTLVSVVEAQWLREDPLAPRPFVVHRLDRDTSGVLVLGRTKEAQTELQRQFETRSTAKDYTAVVRGAPDPAEGTVELELAPDPRRPGAMCVVATGGKASSTDYRLIERFKGFSLLSFRPHTGRTHQIRVVAAHLGCPLAVDPLYGGEPALLLSSIKRGYRPDPNKAESPLIARLSLHAGRLELAHPVSGERLSFAAPLPADMRATINQLRRWRGQR